MKFTFVVDELARLRGVSVSDNEVVQAVYFEAYRYNQDPKALLESYQQQGILPAIKMSLIESKLFNDIFAPKKDENSAPKAKSASEKSENSSNASEKSVKSSQKAVNSNANLSAKAKNSSKKGQN